MSEVRIVKLGPISDGMESVSFEDAFGEFSNAGGRERRKKRRLERISDRREVKTARQEAKGDVQQARVERKATKKATRQGSRLARREEGTASRLARRTGRADLRDYRRDLRNPQEQGVDQDIPQEMGQPIYDAPIQEQSYAPETSYAPENYNDGGLSPQQGQGSYYGDESQSEEADYGYEPEYGYEDEPLGEADYEGYDEGADNMEFSPESESAYEQGFEDAQNQIYNQEEGAMPFDGIMGAEDRYNELQDKNEFPINPGVQELADKCIWNEKLIEALKVKRKNADGNPQELSKTILSRTQRLKDLNNELLDYSNLCGNYSNAEGGEDLMRNRKREIAIARRKAKAKAMGKLTKVDSSLNPNIQKNRIVIPSEQNSNATGTGINGLDMIDDYDAPAIREVFLGADGSKSKSINIGSVALGVLLAVGFIYVNKKYKLVKL
jgi:hypothetical protein